MQNRIQRFFRVFDRHRSPIRISAEPTFFGLTVHYGGRNQPGLGEDDFRKMTFSWLEGHAAEPLRSEVRRFLENGLVAMTDSARRPPAHSDLELLRLSNPRAGELELLEGATRVAVLCSLDRSLHRTGFWAANAGARALALSVNGVILDPAIPRLHALSKNHEPLPADGRLRMLLDILRAGGHIDPASVPEGTPGLGIVSLRFRPGRRGGDSFLTLVPPASFRGGHQAWLEDLCQGFFGQGGSPGPSGTAPP
jgi:hypothetical protein